MALIPLKGIGRHAAEINFKNFSIPSQDLPNVFKSRRKKCYLRFQALVATSVSTSRDSSPLELSVATSSASSRDLSPLEFLVATYASSSRDLTSLEFVVATSSASSRDLPLLFGFLTFRCPYGRDLSVFWSRPCFVSGRIVEVDSSDRLPLPVSTRTAFQSRTTC